MSETKMFAVIGCAICLALCVSVYCSSKKEEAIGIEKEKTKQLELKFKTDSLNAVRTNTK